MIYRETVQSTTQPNSRNKITLDLVRFNRPAEVNEYFYVDYKYTALTGTNMLYHVLLMVDSITGTSVQCSFISYIPLRTVKYVHRVTFNGPLAIMSFQFKNTYSNSYTEPVLLANAIYEYGAQAEVAGLTTSGICNKVATVATYVASSGAPNVQVWLTDGSQCDLDLTQINITDVVIED